MTIGQLRRVSRAAINGGDQFICSFQSWKDIKKQLRRAEYNSRPFAKRLTKFFQSDDEIKTCQRIWGFLRMYINYEAEPKARQTAKTIPRFFVEQKGDCKHYAVTSVGILTACGIPSWFVIVRQTNDQTRWHVYAAAMIDNEVVVVDPCRKIFNSECRFVKRYNVPPIKKIK